MILPEIKKSIDNTHLRHQDVTLLHVFLKNFNQEEQKSLLELASRDKNFWVKLVVRVRIVNNELRNGSTTFITHELKKADEKLKKLKNKE